MSGLSWVIGGKRLTIQYVTPSKPMYDTKGFGKKLSDNFESHLHDHLEIIIDSKPINIENTIIPASFRSELLIHVKTENQQENIVDAWFRLIVTFRVTTQIQIHNFWIDKLSGNSDTNKEIIDSVAANLDLLIPVCVNEISNNFTFNNQSETWLVKS